MSIPFTTIPCITGALPVGKGEIGVDGHLITNLPADEISSRGIALVTVGRMCFPNLTAREHLIAFARQPNQKNERSATATHAPPWGLARIYDLFPRLKERKQHIGNQLSGGEQQMLAIGGTLSTNPTILTLDEAAAELVPVVRAEIWRSLKFLKTKRTNHLYF